MKNQWGSLHRRSLSQNRPDLLRELSQQGKLKSHLQEVDQEAQEMFESISTRLKTSNPTWTPEQIAQSAKEVVLQDLVLVKDKETERAEIDGYLD